jgi:ABC-type uncharacterized transport system substrate-binding protein
MRRREFIERICALAATTAIKSESSFAEEPSPAQQQTMPVVAVVRIGKRGDATYLQDAFLQGLTQAGYVENHNVAIEWRWADGRYELLPGILAELVGRQVAAIAVLGGTAVTLAAKTATQTIPIVFMMGGDPVEFGLVASLAHPGGKLQGLPFSRRRRWRNGLICCIN